MNSKENGLDFIQDIIINLENTYKSPERDIRRKSEKFLKEAEKDILNYFPIALEVIKSNQLSKELNNSLVIYMRNTIINKKNSKELSEEFIINLLKIIVDCILDISYPDNCLKEMNKCFEELIAYNIIEKNPKIIEELMEIFKNKINENAINPLSYKGLGYIFENILCSSSTDEKNADSIISMQLNSTDFMINKIINILRNIQINNDNDRQKVSILLDEIKVLFSLLLNISVHSQKTFKNSDKFKDLLTGIFSEYGIQMMNINFEDKNDIGFKMKTKILKFIISTIPLLPNFINNKDLLLRHQKLIMYCINTLETPGIINKIIGNTFFEKYAEQMILYLKKIGFSDSFRLDFEKYLLTLTKKIVIPLLVSSENEYADIEDDEEGNNYANYIYDIVLTRKSKNLNVSISKFLYFGSKSENYLKFLLEYSIDCIQLTIGIKIEQICNPNIVNLKEDYMLVNNNINEIMRIETCFMILCILSKRIIKSENQNEYIQILIKFTQENLNLLSNFINQFSLIKERVCLFFSIYITQFLDNNINSEIFKNIFDFLFFNIFNEGRPVGKYESFEAIKKAMTHKFFNNSILDKIIEKYSMKFISYIVQAKNPLYFEILSQISESIKNEDMLFELLNSLFNRVIKEISPRRLSHNTNFDMKVEGSLTNNYKTIINKCFEVIRSIFNNELFIIKYYYKIEEMINPLLKYMKYPNKIDFDDDIVIIITIIIKILKKIPLCAINLLPDLPKYLRKNKGMNLLLYELINQYIINDNENILIKEENSKVFFKLFKKSFAKENDEISSYLATLIAQIWFTVSNNIPSKIIMDIILFSLERLHNILLNEKSNHSDMSISINEQSLSMSLITLLFCSFINYPIISCNNIKFEELIHYTHYQFAYDIYSPYQVKLLILGDCSLIRNEKIFDNFQNIIPSFLNISFRFLKNLKKHESNSLKKNDNKEIRKNLIDDDNEDDNEIENENENEEEEMTLEILDDESKIYEERGNIKQERIYEFKEIDYRTINPIKNIDEYKIFKECIEMLKNKKCDILNKWMGNLNEEDMKSFSDIIATIRINIQNGKNNIDVPRKLVKIKKSENNI